MRTLALILCTIGITSLSMGQGHCFTDENNQQLLKQNPERVQQLKDYNSAYNVYKSSLDYSKQSNSTEIVYIPVVFHIVYKTSVQNIPDSRIYEQIERLNQDYSATNTDISAVPNVFEPYISDTKIRFILADTDPNGNPTTGITRHQSNTFMFNVNIHDIKTASTDGVDPWDTDNYLNIWVGNITSGYLGYATTPMDAGTSLDGVVLNYLNVGNNPTTPYDKGRTATHEIGHYLGLNHIWGPGLGSCALDDGINDTPDQSSPHYGVPTHPIETCNSEDMFMNFMDYGNDEALVMFTEDQKDKLEYSLDVLRYQLWLPESVGLHKSNALSVDIFPNPTSDVLHISLSKPVGKGHIYIIDITGRTYYNKDISYKKKITIPVTNLSKGMYFVGFTGNDTLDVIHKIIIN